MVQKQIVNQPKSIVEVEVQAPWADIASKWDETVQKLSADAEVPGFRKGAAPTEMVEPKIAAQVQQEFLKVVMPQALIEALQGTEIVPIDYPQYQLVSFQKGQNLVFKARLTQRPTIKVGDYKQIKVTKPAAKAVSDDDVNKVIDDLFKRWKARQGMQPPLDNSTQGQGASGTMNFNAPAASKTPALAASDAPDDTFAKAVGGESLVDLKQKIKQDLEAEANFNTELDFEEAILQQVEKITEVEIPEVLVQDELNRMLVSLQRRVADMGLLLDDYLRNQNKTLDQIKADWRDQAEKNVRMELGLSEIARTENVNISDEQLQAEIDKIQDARTKQQFESQEPRMHLRHALRQTQTLNLLKTIVAPV